MPHREDKGTVAPGVTPRSEIEKTSEKASDVQRGGGHSGRWSNSTRPSRALTPEQAVEKTGNVVLAEFANMSWTEITSALQHESADGTKPVMQIEFKSEWLG